MARGFYSTREVAELVGTDEWRVRRLFECGELTEPQRFAGKRVIPSALVPQIVDALRARRWLPLPPREAATSV
ncbi:MAG: hypothetical protein SGJ19_23235 [Planctomycetia bacterium]|nr:hypothetical protein [Planctomycetia bacterium]